MKGGSTAIFFLLSCSLAPVRLLHEMTHNAPCQSVKGVQLSSRICRQVLGAPLAYSKVAISEPELRSVLLSCLQVATFEPDLRESTFMGAGGEGGEGEGAQTNPNPKYSIKPLETFEPVWKCTLRTTFALPRFPATRSGSNPLRAPKKMSSTRSAESLAT